MLLELPEDQLVPCLPSPTEHAPESKRLTEPNTELARLIQRTPAGMAHWAGTGPSGATCGKCEHYDYFDAKMKRYPNGCVVYYASMRINCKTPIPARTPACRFFRKCDDRFRSRNA
jgi:hypothetical protein